MSTLLAGVSLLEINILLKYFICLHDLTQFLSSDVLSYHIIAESCLHSPLSSFSSACFCIILKTYWLLLLRAVLQCVWTMIVSRKSFFYLSNHREPELVTEYHIY